MQSSSDVAGRPAAPRRSAIARRLAAAFVALLALFAAALGVELYALARIADAERVVERVQLRKSAASRAAAMLREQYIHQAHTIINWDESHLDHYGEVAEETRAATQALVASCDDDDQRRRASEIGALAIASDEDFRRETLAAIRRDDRSQVRELHMKAELVISRAVDLLDSLIAEWGTQGAEARERAAAARAQARVWTVACFVVAILLAAIVALALTASIVRTLRALREHARRVGRGDLGARLALDPRRPPDDFAELADAFNQMTADLDRHQVEHVRSQKLASIGHVAAGVAHEINNPLGVILGYVRLLRRDPRPSDAEALRILEDEAVQCQRIVRGLLDLARPDSLKLSTVDIADLTRDTVERLDAAGRFEGRAVDVSGLRDPVYARADEARLRQVVTNVLTNAIEATPAGKTIVAVAERDGAAAGIVIDDAGEGIPEEAREKVFEPFFTTKPAGVGLGLAIAQAILEAHGGTIAIAPAPSGGTRVSLRLPAQADRAR